jgi:hypothetical protein
LIEEEVEQERSYSDEKLDGDFTIEALAARREEYISDNEIENLEEFNLDQQDECSSQVVISLKPTQLYDNLTLSP